MVWSDVILQIERLYTLRLLFWGASSTVVGTGLLVLSLTQGGSTMIRRFAVVCAVFGACELILAAIGYRHLALRDLAGATRLERLAWMQLGLYLGLVAVGAVTCVVARSVASRAGASTDVALPSIGTGIAVALHGLALATLELILLAGVSH